jgi:molybdopterin-containing oxidoreductase family membrane subunit
MTIATKSKSVRAPAGPDRGFLSSTHLKAAFWALGGILIAVGAWAWIDRWVNADKNVDYGSVVPWGLWVAMYIYFIGLSAGAFLVSSLVYVFRIRRFESIGRIALFTAVITLVLALLSISADLGHTFRAWHVLVYPNFKSPMAWMIWLYAAYFVILLLELWFVMRHDLVVGARENSGFRSSLYRLLVFGSKEDSEAVRKSDMQIVQILAIIGVPVAIMFHGGVGSLFGVVSSRPAWHGGLFPILFLVSALASGGALLVVVSAIFQDGLRRNRDTILALGTLVLGLLLLDTLFLVSETLVGFYGNAPERIENLELIYTGPYWYVFWFWQLGIGTLIPIALLALPTRRDPRLVTLACLLIAVGFLGVRLNIVMPGLATEQIEGLTAAFASERVSTDYFPSVMEWLFSAGIVGIGLILFGIIEWLLPKSTSNVAEEVTHGEA